MKKIEMTIECKSCNGTGLYSGMGECKGVAVVCTRCKGSGAYKYKFEYNDFTGRNERDDINRVYLKGYGYKLGRGVIDFKSVGKINMDEEGVSYQEFLDGKMPEHIKRLACPMSADQSACHKIDGFTEKCSEYGLYVGGIISQCPHQPHKTECWKRFERG